MTRSRFSNYLTYFFKTSYDLLYHMSGSNKPKNKLTSIKTSVFSRSFSVAKLGLNAGLKYAATRVTNSSVDDFLISQAKSVSKDLGELKGSLMKAGQMLSMYGEYFFPPAANQFLKTLQSDSPPMEWSVIHRYLSNYLSEDLLSELEIDPTPVGNASLGQVHKAKIISTGEIIALKIQYPDVDKAIDSDIQALKVLLKVARVIPESIDLNPIFEEVKTMLHQELDYEHEARLTTSYGEKIKGDNRYVVPQVFGRYSNKRVLATTYLEGFKADHPLIQNLSQKRRNKLSENFLELYLREIFEWNLVQTDPHLGNYKIQIDPLGNDKIALLDFGATKAFPLEFIKHYRKMVKGAVLPDLNLLLSGSRGMGFIIPKDTQEYIAAFTSFCFGTVEPFWAPDDEKNASGRIQVDGVYNWKQTDLPGRVVKKALQFKNFDLRTPPKDILFIDRKTGGVFIFLAVLQAEINARKIIEPFLAKV